MRARSMPDELLAALRTVYAVEQSAGRLDQWRRAVRATANLMLTAIDAGWRLSELADAMGMERSAASKRVVAARKDRHNGPAGLQVPPPPIAAPGPLHGPADQRGWLDIHEAAMLAGVSVYGIRLWRDAGLLPNTRYLHATRLLFARTDIERVLSAPRYNAHGVSYAAVLKQITAGATSTRNTLTVMTELNDALTASIETTTPPVSTRTTSARRATTICRAGSGDPLPATAMTDKQIRLIPIEGDRPAV